MPNVWSPVVVSAKKHPRTGRAGVVVKSDYTPAAEQLAEAARLAVIADSSELAAKAALLAAEIADDASNEAAAQAKVDRADADAAAAAGKAKDQSPCVDVRFDAVGDDTEQPVESVRVADLTELI